MILQRKFIQMLLIILTCIFSISIGQINSPEKPKSPNQIQVMDDDRVHDLHQYLLDNKVIFEKNHIVNKQSVLTGFNSYRLGVQYYSKNFWQYINFKTIWLQRFPVTVSKSSAMRRSIIEIFYGSLTKFEPKL